MMLAISMSMLIITQLIIMMAVKGMVFLLIIVNVIVISNGSTKLIRYEIELKNIKL